MPPPAIGASAPIGSLVAGDYFRFIGDIPERRLCILEFTQWSDGVTTTGLWCYFDGRNTFPFFLDTAFGATFQVIYLGAY